MQQALQKFNRVNVPGGGTISLSIKIAVAAGPVRRFIVGDPKIQLIDIMAGKTLDRLIAAEQQAFKGEVLLHEQDAAALGDQLAIRAWRDDPETGARFAVVDIGSLVL